MLSLFTGRAFLFFLHHPTGMFFTAVTGITVFSQPAGIIRLVLFLTSVLQDIFLNFTESILFCFYQSFIYLIIIMFLLYQIFPDIASKVWILFLYQAKDA